MVFCFSFLSPGLIGLASHLQSSHEVHHGGWSHGTVLDGLVDSGGTHTRYHAKPIQCRQEERSQGQNSERSNMRAVVA
mgnify:CR=1 FL=1